MTNAWTSAPCSPIADLVTANEAVGREKDKLTVKELRAILAMRSVGGAGRAEAI